VAIVDDEGDQALKTIRKLGIRYLISSSNCVKCSGKVRALSTAMEKLRDYQVYVVVDSDVQVGRDWLASLVRPLQDKKVGLSTMYPYFRPLGGFWSQVRMVWGFVGDSLLERESSRFAWGGSMAFRKELMDSKAFKFFKDSDYSVSDDICLTKIAKSKGLRIAYVKSPKPVVNCRESFSTFLEWSNRQTALTALGYRRNLYLGLVYYSMEIWLVISSIILSVFLTPIFLIMLLHYVKSVANAYRRSGMPGLQIPIIVLMLPFLYDVNLIRASRMRSIKWRGRTYPMRQ
jgi:cellulose synthase/poly-beta-1,6-N-acetylglucosamine synthase-like glycosyltransferase